MSTSTSEDKKRTQQIADNEETSVIATFAAKIPSGKTPRHTITVCSVD